MCKINKNSENGNEKFVKTDYLQTSIPEKQSGERLSKLLQRAVNSENPPESLKQIIQFKLRQ